MKFRTVKYHIRQGTQSLFKNRLMSLASIATVAANAFIFIISLCLVLNLDYMLEQVENTVGISVFMSNEATDEEIINIQQRLSEIEHIKEVEYISADDALEKSKKDWDSDILEGLENDNPFPEGFDIKIDNVKNQGSVIEELNKLQLDVEVEMLKTRGLLKAENKSASDTADTSAQGENNTAEADILISRESIGGSDYSYIGIEKISHAQKESQMLTAINTALRIISIILILIMCSIAVAIIMNTIKLTVFIRKNEINIMKYVGATDWFIRWPFIIEGLLIGLVGSVIPCIICMIGYSRVIELINEKIAFLANLASFKTTGEIFLFIFPLTVLLGMFLGAFGSITSIRKHLNV